MKQKELTELSLDELWQLFPIILTAHQDCWAEWYKEEAELLKEQLSYAKRISHIGSTAINLGKTYHRYTCRNLKRRKNHRFEKCS